MNEDNTAFLVQYRIPAKELRKMAESQVYSNLDFDGPNPESVVVMCPALTHSAPQIQIDDQTTVSIPCCKGYCSSKASHGVECGKWYFEVTIARGWARVGWGQALAELQAPVGYDEYGYGFSNKHRSAFHCSRKMACSGFGSPEVIQKIGCLLDIPSTQPSRDSSVRQAVEQQFPPLNFNSMYKIHQEPLATGSIQFYLDDQVEVPATCFQNIYRAKYFPMVSVFGDAMVHVNFSPLKCPDGSLPFCKASQYKEE